MFFQGMARRMVQKSGARHASRHNKNHDKKLNVMRENRKSSVKKCSDIRKVLSNEADKNELDDKKKSLKDFLSLI